uniref:Insulin-like growth factor-binding protein complex acid labile subunit b n=1 Tax=Sinonovacula constricta TaxID=98310 RepID=A0A7S6PSI1_SINCO|nr:insulin-like growth factor-binding protein complex acid labile subunit b [Sinonovacula constricta]
MIAVWLAFSLTFGLTTSFSCPDIVKQSCQCFTIYDNYARNEARHYVNCSSRDLRAMPYMDFKTGTRIHELLLQNNSITSLSSENFSRKVHIRYIDISTNPFVYDLEKKVLKNNIVGLKIVIARAIGLNLNNISALSFVKDLHVLEELDISRNLEYVVSMMPPLFIENNLYALKKLSISLCRLQDINAHSFIGLNNLRELDLSSNYLNKVPRALKRLSLLRRLNLRLNDITVIYHGDFKELRCLEELDLSRNLLGQIEAFRNGAFLGMENSLTHLTIQGADIPLIPSKSFSNLKRLKSLDVSQNKITFMNSSSFLGRYNLENLDISDNPWLFDNDMFQGLQASLTSLSMRKIGVSFMPTLPLQKLTKLLRLDMSYNRISTLTNDSLTGIHARIMNFSNNKIRHISPQAFSHYRLPIAIDLSHNAIETLDFVFESRPCTIYTLNISGNGFLCDCQMEKLINSKRVEQLSGTCIVGDKSVDLLNQTVVTEMERYCGRSERTLCFWWVPKSKASPTTYRNTVLIIFMIFIQGLQIIDFSCTYLYVCTSVL